MLDCPTDGSIKIRDIVEEINNHTQDTNNPHTVTATQLGAIVSDVSGITGATTVTNIIALSQTDYESITPDANTLYIITG